MIKASDCKCCKCGKQAVAFFPCIDPDIPSYPYCDECLDKAKEELAMTLWIDDPEQLLFARLIIEEQKRQRKKQEKPKRNL